MKKISKYKQQIATFVTITLLVTYGIFPALTAANTFLNILGGIGALLFLIWGGLELYQYIISDKIEVEKTPTLKTKPNRKYTKKTK
jgi:purine-cytosine permease-like protein